ncbi:hypothetical protein N8742_00665 [Emcibacteraceae bacterium]|nr:hypothetical protein [Emcibacteraceae bacterium]
MHALVYIRRHKGFDNIVLDYARNNLKSTKISTISEYFNGNFRIDMNYPTWDYCSITQDFIEENLELDEIIFRDRVLRNTPFKECLVLIRRATGNIREIFKNNNFDVLVTYPVDNYIMDILMQVAKINNIPIKGICSFFVSGFKRLTIYGEHNPIRNPSKNEVDLVLDTLKNNFRSHMSPSRGKALKSAIIRYIKYKARYPIFYILGAKILGRKEYDLLATPYNTTVRNFYNFFVERHFTTPEKIDFEKKSILIPLHYFPEATIEYWSDNYHQIEFEDMLLCKIDELSERYDQIILKEHPATVFDNPNSFYKLLKNNKKVILIDPFVSTNELLDKIAVLGCWTGSAGIEALVNGKKVEFFVQEQYYYQALKLHPDIIQRDGKMISIKNPYLFIEEILKGSIPFEG